jgi:hypothetical protein
LDPRKFPAVAIATAADCCEAVQQRAGHRFLAVEAPRLPLKDCTQPHACQCRYTKYTDRRDSDDERRHRSASTRSVWYAGQERRQFRARRRDD